MGLVIDQTENVLPAAGPLLEAAETPAVEFFAAEPDVPADAGVAKLSPKAAPKIPMIIILACYSAFPSMYMLVSLVAPFFPNRADDWGLSASEIGNIIAMDPVGEVLAAVIGTWVMAKLGTKNAGVAGMVVNAVSSVVFGVAPVVSTARGFLLPVFIMSRLMNGVATTVTYVAMFTMLCTLQPGKVGTVTAYATALTTIGVMVGPPFGGTLHSFGGVLVRYFELEEDWQFATPFIGCSILLVVPTIVLFLVPPVEAGAEEGGEGEGEEEEVSFVEEVRRMVSVVNVPILAGAVSLITSCIMMNAIYPILAPHLEPRCTQVRKTPSWPRSWADFSLLQLYDSHRNA